MDINNTYIQVGDKVTYEFKGDIYTVVIVENGQVITKDANILKIERPTYEVVAESKEKILLTKDEKIYLNKIINSDMLRNIDVRTIQFKKSFNDDWTDHVIIEFSSDTFKELEVTNHTYRFDGVEDDISYSLPELGL